MTDADWDAVAQTIADALIRGGVVFENRRGLVMLRDGQRFGRVRQGQRGWTGYVYGADGKVRTQVLRDTAGEAIEWVLLTHSGNHAGLLEAKRQRRREREEQWHDRHGPCDPADEVAALADQMADAVLA